MDRLISEQKVLDAICKSCSVESKPNKCQYKKGLNGGCLEYETVKAIPSAEPTEEQIKAYIRKRKMVLVEDDFMKHIIKGTPQAYIYKEMTNGEVIKTVFPNGKVLDKDECIGFEIIFDDGTSYCSFFDGVWWNAPYEPQESEEE